MLPFFALALAGLLVSVGHAQVRANPSLEINLGFALNDPIKAHCQGTLIARVKDAEGWRCTLATASHCLLQERNQAEATFIEGPRIGYLKKFDLVFKERATRYPSDDLAVVHFREGCEKLPAEALVALHPRTLATAAADSLPSQAFVASRAFGLLLNGFISPGHPRAGQFGLEIVLGGKAFAGNLGDAGGGIFVRNEKSGELELIGVISSGLYIMKNKEEEALDDLKDYGSWQVLGSGDLPWIEKQLVVPVRQTASTPAQPSQSPTPEKDLYSGQQLLELERLLRRQP